MHISKKYAVPYDDHRMPRSSAKSKAPEKATADVLGYEVTAPTSCPTAQLMTFVREFKRLHERHRLPCAITMTIPPWSPTLGRQE